MVQAVGYAVGVEYTRKTATVTYVLPREGKLNTKGDLIGAIEATGTIAGPRYVRARELTEKKGEPIKHGLRVPVWAASQVLVERKDEGDNYVGPTKHDPCAKMTCEWRRNAGLLISMTATVLIRT